MHSELVLIRGHVFKYAEKAPFVASGESIYGAIEFKETEDLCRCHECGIFIRGLGNHIKFHGMRREEYNLRHGLRIATRLSPPSLGKKHAKLARASGYKGIKACLESIRKRRPARPNFVHSGETANLNARCRAQLYFRVGNLAAQLGHTPTGPELASAGISASSIRRQFGGKAGLCRILEIQPNGSGQRGPSPLPKNWESRMPWPKDYFGVQPLNRRNG